MNLSDLSDMQLDALIEIGNIGAGHAVTALSNLVGRVIRLEVPTIEILDITDMPDLFGGAEQLAGAVFARIEGQIDGAVMFIAAPESIRTIVEMLGETPAAPENTPDERLAGILVEVARLLIDSYLRAVTEITGLESSAPDLAWAYDMAGALIEAVVAEIGLVADQAVLVRTSFIDKDLAVVAPFLFVPDPDSLEAILSRLGLA